MTTVATTIPIPVPNKPQKVRFGLEAGNSNFVRVWCTSAPDGSKLDAALASKSSSRVQVYEGPGGVDAPWRYTFDEGGAYSFSAQEYSKNTFGGGYTDDPRGAPTETKVGGESTLTLYVAQRVTQKLGVGDDAAALLLFLLNDTIVQTYGVVHGEDSPTIINPTSDKAKTASATTAVVSAVNSMIGFNYDALLGNLTTVFNDRVDRFNAHAQNNGGAYHDIVDNQDDLANNYGNPSVNDAFATSINKLRLRFSQHVTNAKENDAAHPEYALPGGRAIHNQFDGWNKLLPITANASAPETIYAAFGDYERAYEAHRQKTTVHNSADTTNVVAAITAPLVILHKEFTAVLAALQPSATPGQSIGVTRLISQGGFVEG